MTLDADLSPALERILRRRVGVDGPGAVVGVYRDGALAAGAAVGKACLEHDVPLTTTTPIEIASISKQLGAATILTMVRDGLLDLDADVREHVPEVQVPGITLRHCLLHTSGLPDYLTVGEIVGVPIGGVIRYDAFLADLARTTELQFPTGSDVSYSNTGYVVAAIAAERAGGHRFPELVDDRVFRPLGMRQSRVRTYVGEVTTGMAFSYAPHPQHGFVRVEMGENDLFGDGRHTVGDGEVLTTIADFAAWHGFLLDGRVLGTDIRDEMLRPGELSEGRRTCYGMGLRHESVGGIEAFGHSGSIWGYLGQSLTDPRSGTGVAVFANRCDVDPADLAWRALRTATDVDQVSGSWYSSDAVRSLDTLLRADGGVDLEVDGESMVFGRAAPAAWESATAEGRIELDGEALQRTDEMGRQVRYVRLPDLPAPPVETVVGTYRGGSRSDACFLIRSGADGLELLRGSFRPLPLRFVSALDGVDVYRVEGGVLAVHRSGDGAPSITISAGSAVLRQIPRID